MAKAADNTKPISFGLSNYARATVTCADCSKADVVTASGTAMASPVRLGAIQNYQTGQCASLCRRVVPRVRRGRRVWLWGHRQASIEKITVC